MKKQWFIGLLIFSLIFSACQKTETLPYKNIIPNLPDTPLDYTSTVFSDLADINNSKATLGRVLFYDKKLSKNNTISCGSCHQQKLAFSSNSAFNVGFNGELTKRNTKALVNLHDQEFFFWDGRELHLHELALKPVVNHAEMGLPGEDVLVEKLQTISYYPDLFKDAFGDPAITSTRVGEALSQFMRSIISYSSRYDLRSQAAGGGNYDEHYFTELEWDGSGIFGGKGKCSKCHEYNSFRSQDLVYANIGLDMEYEDKGAGDLWPTPNFYEGNFTIPSLRNIALTAPYMHDGRFETLEEVVEHYNSQVKPHPNLHYIMKNIDGVPRQLNLTSYEKEALIAFLKSLTDQRLTTDERFSDPFEN